MKARGAPLLTLALGAGLLPAQAVATDLEPAPPPNVVDGQPYQPAKDEAAEPPPARIQQIDATEAAPILGKDVKDLAGKDSYGKIVDVLVGPDGKPAAAIIDFGGFLGVGSRKVAVQWSALEFRPANKDAPILLHMEQAQIAAAPEYKESAEPAKVAAPPMPQQPSEPQPELPPPAAGSSAEPPPQQTPAQQSPAQQSPAETPAAEPGAAANPPLPSDGKQ